MKTTLGSVVAVVLAITGHASRASLASADDRTHGAERVIAEAKRGAELWHQACPVPEIDGVCKRAVRPARPAAPHQLSQCGPDSRVRFAIVTREARKEREALAAFKRATDEYERWTGQLDLDARHAYALARTLATDRDLEAYLRLELPVHLSFDPDPASKALTERSASRLAEWVQHTTDRAAALVHALEPVVALRDEAAITAAARIGQIQRGLADALLTAEIPKDAQRDAPRLEAFCDRLTPIGEAFEDKAADAFAACLATGTSLGIFTAWSKLCERELAELRPEQYPIMSERSADPGAAAAITVTEPPSP